MLRRWRRQLEEKNRRLKKELAFAQEKRDILKKAMAIFSRATKMLYRFIRANNPSSAINCGR